ncbi:two-component system NtrC family response regulator [Pedobacter sp. UYP30]|uniref:sigma-54-dependent transcriptional regulator n=1 Tax=Pedobacter sp. UYP30 TaxID=1756400 RepID=UPI00339A0892
MANQSSGKILIIDDEKKLSQLLARILSLEGYEVFEAINGKAGLNMLKQQEIDVVISDVKLPDVNGVELVREIKKISPNVEVINLTAYGTIKDGVMAMRNGAFDYITKGDDNDRIIPLVSKAVEKVKLNSKLSYLENKGGTKFSFASILGQSAAIKEAVTLARKVSTTDTTVLLLGETGTGKEVFSQSIHYEGQRKLKPFVALNCSGFNPNLLESELFGYKAGAFTGADKDKRGLLEEADGGTLFLDEIGEMNMDLQAKLLRVLENQTFIKVGDTQTKKVDVRIIAATNRDLKKEAEQGKFRLDLFYRLSVFSIELPPLTQRRGDILPIAMHYLTEFTANANKPTLIIDDEFATLLTSYNWKGNIRELKNVMERVVILADDDKITPNLLPYEFHHKEIMDDPMNMQTVEKQHIIKVLHYTKGNKTESARLLGIGLTTLYRKIDEYQIP